MRAIKLQRPDCAEKSATCDGTIARYRARLLVQSGGEGVNQIALIFLDFLTQRSQMSTPVPTKRAENHGLHQKVAVDFGVSVDFLS